jgi:outer membrane protein assembly factor BamB
MREDFVTRLQLQLRDAAQRDARAGAFGHVLRGARWRLTSPVMAGGLAALLAVIAVVAGVMLMRDEPEPAGPPVVAKLQLTGNPEFILPAFGSLWISDPVAGEMVRVDPETRKVLARIPVGSATFISFEAVGRELWVRSQRDTAVQRIDPATNTVRARFEPRTPDGRAFRSVGVIADRAGVWALGDGGALRLDRRTGAGLDLVGAPTKDSEVIMFALGDEYLWSLGTDGRILRFDAATGELHGELPPGPGGGFIAGYEDDVIVGAGNTFVRLDGTTGRTLWERSIGDRINADTAADGLIWVHTSTAGQPDRLTAVAADSGKTVSSTALDSFGSTGLAVIGREVWINTPVGDTVVVRY